MADMETHFLPTARDEAEELRPLAKRFKESLTGERLASLPVGIVILNVNRQVIYCNGSFRKLSQEMGVTDVVGLRPGEALGCVHASIMPGGCGASRFCRHCGAAIAILQSFQDSTGLEECLMKRRHGEHEDSLVFQVFTSSFIYEDQDFVLFSVLDIRHEKRASEMERLVFHKLLNSASGMVMLTNLIEDEAGEAMDQYTEPLRNAAKGLVNIIRTQQAWRAAEQGRLRVMPEPVLPEDLLRRILAEAVGRDPDREWECAVDCSCASTLRTDPKLLQLILSVFLENAFEAMPRGGAALFGCRETEQGFHFFVSNEGIPPERVQTQFFKRSFTTKGDGRGFGLYRAKLLAEHYLCGSIGVEYEDGRTTFFVELPAECAEKE